MAFIEAIDMTWENMPQVMVNVFPDLREPYEELLSLWSRRSNSYDTNCVPGNHVIYGDIFAHYLILLLGEKEKHYLNSQFRQQDALDLTQRKQLMKDGFNFLEGMCLNEDIRIQEVAVVTILEYMHGNSNLLALAKPHCGPASLAALGDIDNFWNSGKTSATTRTRMRRCASCGGYPTATAATPSCGSCTRRGRTR